MIYESANSFGVNCARCKLYMPPGHADIIHLEARQPYFTCPRCTLSCGFQVDPTVEENLASFRATTPGGVRRSRHSPTRSTTRASARA